MTQQEKPLRIGIYAGTFDPVHSGHLSFALHAQAVAQLDEVYLMPERLPRYKPAAEHYGHRVAMLRRAIRPHASLSMLELADKHFTVRRTMPQLKKIFPADGQLALLMGADVFVSVPAWPGARQLLQHAEFIVSVRTQHELTVVLHTMHGLGLPSRAITIIDSLQPDLSSTQIRQAIRLNVPVKGLLPSVHRYARQEWLYAQLP